MVLAQISSFNFLQVHYFDEGFGSKGNMEFVNFFTYFNGSKAYFQTAKYMLNHNKRIPRSAI